MHRTGLAIHGSQPDLKYFHISCGIFLFKSRITQYSSYHPVVRTELGASREWSFKNLGLPNFSQISCLCLFFFFKWFKTSPNLKFFAEPFWGLNLDLIIQRLQIASKYTGKELFKKNWSHSLAKSRIYNSPLLEFKGRWLDNLIAHKK